MLDALRVPLSSSNQSGILLRFPDYITITKREICTC
jgi:hypothetical protein